jgi:hypothetical protein
MRQPFWDDPPHFDGTDIPNLESSRFKPLLFGAGQAIFFRRRHQPHPSRPRAILICAICSSRLTDACPHESYAAVNETIKEPTKPASHQAGKQRARPLANKISRLDRNGLILLVDSSMTKMTQSQPSNSSNFLDETKNFLDETKRAQVDRLAPLSISVSRDHEPSEAIPAASPWRAPPLRPRASVRSRA